MAPKKSASATGAAAHSASASFETAETQFWKSLKGGDLAELERCLFTLQQNPASSEAPAAAGASADSTTTGAPARALHPFAKKLVSSQNAKKVTPLNFVIDTSLETAHVDLLLEAGADLNARDGTKQQRTPLHTACWGEEDVLLDHLLLRGADPSVVNADGSTVFHISVKSSSAGVLAYLLEMDDPERLQSILPIPPTSASVIRKAREEWSVLKLLHIKDHQGISALHYAIGELGGGYDAEKVVKTLLSFLKSSVWEATEGKTDVKSVARRSELKSLLDLRTTTGLTALHMAALCGVDNSESAAAVSMLISLGADPSACIAIDLLNLEETLADDEQQMSMNLSDDVLETMGSQYTAVMSLAAASSSAVTTAAALRTICSLPDDPAALLKKATILNDLTLLHVAVRHRRSRLIREVLFHSSVKKANGESSYVPTSAVTSSPKSQALLTNLLGRQLAIDPSDASWQEIRRLLVEGGYVRANELDDAVRVASEKLNEVDDAAEGEEGAAEAGEGDYSGFGSGTLSGTRAAGAKEQSKRTTESTTGGDAKKPKAAAAQPTKSAQGTTSSVAAAAVSSPTKLSWPAMLLLASFALSFLVPLLDWILPKQ